MHEMTNLNQPKYKKRRITRKNRSAWILSIVLIILMVLRMVAGYIRPARANHVITATPTAELLPELTTLP